MPIPLPPTHDNGVIDHLDIVIKLVSPLIASIVALIIWAWRKMEKSIDHVEDSLTDHIQADENVHDKLFTESRKQGEDIREIKTRQADCDQCP